MEYDPKDVDVIQLLKNLKESNGAYPREMLALRRQGYLRQVAEISAGAGLTFGLKNAAKGGKGGVISPTAGTVVEILLLTAILAEAGAVTYFYRDKITDYINSFSNQPKVQEVASPPVLPPTVVEIELTLTPTSVMTLRATDTATPIGTPSLEIAVNPTDLGGGNNGNNQPGLTSGSAPGSTSGTTANSTPDPNGNNGNHYGQTPKPERTKETDNQNNNSTNNDQNNINSDTTDNIDNNTKPDNKKKE